MGNEKIYIFKLNFYIIILKKLLLIMITIKKKKNNNLCFTRKKKRSFIQHLLSITFSTFEKVGNLWGQKREFKFLKNLSMWERTNGRSWQQ